jgi:hypothetical protein
MKPMGMALVGIGPGSVPHLLSLNDLRAEVDLRWAVTRRPDVAQMGPFQGSLQPSSDFQAMLNDSAVQAVIIATPAATHLEMAQACFAHGKHVLLEKPLDVSLARAKAIVEMAQQHQRQLGVVLQHRFRPGVERLQALLDTQGLGMVQAASVSIPWWRPQSYYDQAGRGTVARDGGGVLITQAIHGLDVFRALVGVRRVVAAQASRTRVHRMDTEDHVQALLELGQGAPGRLMATTAHYPGGTERIEVIGQLGTAVLEGGHLRVDFISGQASIEVKAEGGTGGGANIMDFPHDWHRALISDFVASIHSRRPSRTHGAEALQTHQLIDDLLARAGHVVDI